MPDVDDGTCLPNPTPNPMSATSESFMPTTADSSSLSIKTEATSNTPSRASTPRSRTMIKHTLQDAFAEGSVKDSQMIECLGTQKRERAIGELELKHHKLENKVMEKQHQREREREQHEFCMMQMRMMMSQNQQAAPMMMPPQNQANQPFERLGLMAKLNDTLLSESPGPSLSTYSI